MIMLIDARQTSEYKMPFYFVIHESHNNKSKKSTAQQTPIHESIGSLVSLQSRPKSSSSSSARDTFVINLAGSVFAVPKPMPADRGYLRR